MRTHKTNVFHILKHVYHQTKPYSRNSRPKWTYKIKLFFYKLGLQDLNRNIQNKNQLELIRMKFFIILDHNKLFNL